MTDETASARRCCVSGRVHICTLPEGHPGMHHSRVGAGSSSWTTACPIWTGSTLDGRYVRPGEPEYDELLERRRATYGPPRRIEA